MLDVTKPVDHRCHLGLRKHRDVPLQRVVIAFGQEEVSEGSCARLMALQFVHGRAIFFSAFSERGRRGWLQPSDQPPC